MSLVCISRNKPTQFKNVQETVTIKPPKAADLFGLDFSGTNAMEATAILLSRCSTLSIEEIKALDAKEFLKLQIEMNKYIEQ